MDERFFGWVFLFFMLAWRSITTLERVQRLLHRCGFLACFLQWYTLTFIGLTLLLAQTFVDIVEHDYIGYHFLSPTRIKQNIDRICAGLKLSDEDCGRLHEDLLIPDWLRKISLVGPFCGVLAFLLLAVMLGRFVWYNHYKKSRGEAGREWRMMPWRLGLRLEWVIIIIGSPLVFIIMAMRSLIRVWAVMTGSCYKPGMQLADWTQMRQVEMATYAMDLELAYGFQFYAIWKFGLLCSSLLEHSKYIRASSDSDREAVKHYKRILAKTSIQGVYAFFIIGLLRSAFDFGVAYFQDRPETEGIADELQERAIGMVGTIFAFVTILCMVNMVLVSKVRDISDNLGNANLKFLGTRLLLLIAQIQPQVLSLAVAGSPLYNLVKDNPSTFQRFHIDLNRWTFTKLQSSLAHVAFLNIEGLVVVIVTIVFWRLTREQRAVLLDEQAREGSWFLCGREVGAREPTSHIISPQEGGLSGVSEGRGFLALREAG